MVSSWLARSPWPLGKEKGSLCGGGAQGGCACPHQGALLDQSWAQAPLEPPCVLCPWLFVLPGGRLWSSVNRNRQKVNLEPDGLCLAKTTLSLANGKWAGIHCSRPRAAPAQLWLRALGTQPPRNSIMLSEQPLSMQASTPRVITLEVRERHSGSTSKVWTSKDSPQWDRWPLAADSSTGLAVTYTPTYHGIPGQRDAGETGQGTKHLYIKLIKSSIHSYLPLFLSGPNSYLLCASQHARLRVITWRWHSSWASLWPDKSSTVPGTQ